VGEVREEPRDHELSDPLRPFDVLQPERSQVTQCHFFWQVVLDQAASGLRQQHLAAVRRIPDASRAVDRETDVALPGGGGLAAVDADPHPNLHTVRPGLGNQGLLDRDRRRNRVCGAAEGDEECVALGVDLAAVVGGERLAQHHLVAGEHLTVALPADLLEQRGRSLDIREQESDRAAQTLRRAPPSCKGLAGSVSCQGTRRGRPEESNQQIAEEASWMGAPGIEMSDRRID
jgi:hypothetical protein